MPEKQFKMVFANYIRNKKTQNVEQGTNLSMETFSSVRQISVILIKMKPNLSHVVCLVITMSPGLNRCSDQCRNKLRVHITILLLGCKPIDFSIPYYRVEIHGLLNFKYDNISL